MNFLKDKRALKLSAELQEQFARLFFHVILEGKNEVKESKVLKFFNKNWLPYARLVPSRKILAIPREKVQAAFSGRDVQFYACGKIAVAYVSGIPVAVVPTEATLAVNRGADWETFIHASYFSDNFGRDLTCTVGKQGRHGAFTLEGALRKQLQSVTGRGNFALA